MAASLEEALGALPPPDRSILSDLGGVPVAPAAGSGEEAAAERHARAAAAQLLRLTQLVESLDVALLGLADLVEQPLPPTSRDAAPRGGVIIEELPADGDIPAPAGLPPALRIVLAALYYCPDARLRRPWSAAPAADAAQHLLAALAEKLSLLDLPDPSAEEGIAAAVSDESSSAAVRRLLGLALPALLPALRPAVMAYAEHAASEATRLDPYNGPDAWERCLAAGQLCSAVRQLSGRELGASLGLVLPYILAAVEDPSPEVQAPGLWALAHVATAAPPSALAPRFEGLAAAARRAAIGCDQRSWPAAAAAAAALGAALLASTGVAPRSPPAVALFEVLLEEAERHSHNASRALAWLHAAPAVFPLLGLQLVRYMSRLAPLLLEWALGVQREVRTVALQALEALIMATWPRMPAHAGVIWAALERVYNDETRLSGRAAPEAVAAVQRCAKALWACGGEAFRGAVRGQQCMDPGDGVPSLLALTLQSAPDSGNVAL